MDPTLISFIVNAIIYGLGFYAGRQYMIKTYARLMVEDTEGMIEHLKNVQKIKIVEDEDNFTEVLVEHRDNSYYVYNKATSLFLGQGKSIDEAMQIVTERYPNQAFMYEETN